MPMMQRSHNIFGRRLMTTKQQEHHSYTAVPSSDVVPVVTKEHQQQSHQGRRYKLLIRLFGILLLVSALFCAIFDDGPDHHHHHHYGHHHRHYMRHYNRHNKRYPTKLPGGGRDWLVNAVHGAIHAKHDPSLVLGIASPDAFPLVLVKSDSPRALNFGPPPKSEVDSVPFGDVAGGGFRVVTGEKQHLGRYHVREASVSSTHHESEALVSFKEDSFIVLESSASACEKHKMVLDVSEWNLVEGSAVNFVEGPHWNSRVAGGGRDFVWNKDGTISTKLNPDLVLGRAFAKLALVNENSLNKLMLKHAQALANGETVPMTLVNGGAVSKRYEQTHEYGPWHYIESQVSTDDTDNAVEITYDGNYISVAGENLVLDVSFWDMEQGTSVNFVGGDGEVVKNTKERNEKRPLRSWASDNVSASSGNIGDSSESSQSSSSTSSDSSSSESDGSPLSFSFSSNTSGRSSDKKEKEILLSAEDVPTKDERAYRTGGTYGE